jgi:hypothetical protein
MLAPGAGRIRLHMEGSDYAQGRHGEAGAYDESRGEAKTKAPRTAAEHVLPLMALSGREANRKLVGCISEWSFASRTFGTRPWIRLPVARGAMTCGVDAIEKGKGFIVSVDRGSHAAPVPLVAQTTEDCRVPPLRRATQDGRNA